MIIHRVMRGLDPRILIDQALRDKRRDCRDKPGNDIITEDQFTCR
jgi:hypothetical protein